ncbi:MULTISPECIES: VOC family protein [Gammaproteobacteria]|uniref:VOC family protein n=1 Tax=Gammaproteobacteria TaxID=1236 RepID=UPI000DD0DA29|nr:MULTISPECIES: VOC family protein [Gammaproteobacteria]RTE87325.1 VOC family protein [Aliidiomarina sp. B3213]TCZ92889.1 VOC family protein [Lysobacter sp. N42]
MNNPIGWFELYVSDMARAVKFYESVFKIKLEPIGNPTEEQLVMRGFPSDMSAYGASGALVCTEGVSPSNNSTIVYFSCENCAEEEARVGVSGGSIVRSKMSIGDYGYVALANDSEGNMIGLHSMN